MDIEELITHGEKYFLPNLSIDLVIIGYQEQQLKCLLLKMGSKWSLPGGYIALQESVEDATYRILYERTGLRKPHLKFLSVFGDGQRSFHEEFKSYFDKHGLPWSEDLWINKRFVTLAFYSLVDIDNTHPIAGTYAEEAAWFSLDDLPAMWLDHAQIAMATQQRLKADIKSEQVTYNLLPPHFTMPQLHQLHEIILGEKLDRSRFQKNMLATGMFERLPQLKKDTPGRNPYQYRIK